MKKLLIPLLVLTMICSLSLCAFAESVQSPTAPVIYQVVVNQPDKNVGSVSQVNNADGTITFTVSAEDEATFTKWVLEGDYEIVSGDLTSKTITIKPKANNVKVNTVFNGEESTTAAQTTTAATQSTTTAQTTTAATANDDNNGSATSPETGAPVATVAVVLATAMGAAFVAKKKLSK